MLFKRTVLVHAYYMTWAYNGYNNIFVRSRKYTYTTSKRELFELLTMIGYLYIGILILYAMILRFGITFTLTIIGKYILFAAKLITWDHSLSMLLKLNGTKKKEFHFDRKWLSKVKMFIRLIFLTYYATWFVRSFVW